MPGMMPHGRGECGGAITLTVETQAASGPLPSGQRSVRPASACPMCKVATEEDDAKPRAYMYSIIFMLAVPATMVGGMVARLVALSRRETASLAESGLTDDDVSVPDTSDC